MLISGVVLVVVDEAVVRAGAGPVPCVCVLPSILPRLPWTTLRGDWDT